MLPLGGGGLYNFAQIIDFYLTGENKLLSSYAVTYRRYSFSRDQMN